MKIFCITVPSVYACQYGPFAMKMLSQTLSFSEKLRALKSFFINTYIKVLFCGQIKCRFLSPNQNPSPLARKTRYFWSLVSLILHRPEKSPNFWPLLRYGPRWPEKRQISWPVHDCDTGHLVGWQRGWQIRRPAPQSKLRELRLWARSACFVPLSPSRKPQSSHAYPNARRKGRPQSLKAGK